MTRIQLRPDGRARVWLPEDRAGSWPATADRLVGELGVPLLLELADERLVPYAEAAGFRLHRREQVWHVPVRPLPAVTTGQHRLRTALEVDVGALADLDNTIRHDIPGAEEWAGSVADLRSTLSDEEFDPALYLVAQELATGRLDGLVRVWGRAPVPRLGCVGVRKEWRRTRLAAMLLGAVAAELGNRRVGHIETETDVTNRDSHGMARRWGGLPQRLVLELVRGPVASG